MSTRIKMLFFLWIVILVSTGCAQLANQDGALQASGTIQADHVSISSQLSGKIAEIYIDEGQPVAAGDPLFRLEDDLYQSQREQAAAAYDSAQANVDLAEIAVDEAALAADTSEAELQAAQADVDLAYDALAAAELQKEIAEVSLQMTLLQHEQARSEIYLSEQPARAESWSEDLAPEFELPSWYFQKTEEITATLALVESTHQDYWDEVNALEDLLNDSAYQEIIAAENRLQAARTEYFTVQQLRDRRLDEGREIDDFIQILFDAAEAELESAQEEYDRVATAELEDDIWEARARVAATKEYYQIALDQYYSLLTGEDSYAYRISELSVHQAEGAVAQADLQITQANHTIAQAEASLAITQIMQQQKSIQLDRAEAALKAAESTAAEAEQAVAAIDTQIEMLTVYAPIAGTVTTNSVAVGEVLQPGMPAMTIADLDNLEVTVYLPEDRYGSVSLGDSAEITTDSFPDEVFSGTVTYISNEAEYTPRNTQTEEDRATTVYAVRLEIKTGIGQLKPGMPVDVTFSSTD